MKSQVQSNVSEDYMSQSQPSYAKENDNMSSRLRSNVLEDHMNNQNQPSLEEQMAKTEVTQNTTNSRHLARYFGNMAYQKSTSVDSSSVSARREHQPRDVSVDVSVDSTLAGEDLVDVSVDFVDSSLDGEDLVSCADDEQQAEKTKEKPKVIMEDPIPLPEATKKEKRKSKQKRKDKEPDFIHDKNFTKKFIREIASEGITLVWHEVQNSQCYIRPTSIRLFLRLSGLGDGNESQEPVFVWDPMTEQADLSCRDRLGCMPLFDIKSVEKAGSTTIHSYPFAIPNNSLVLTMNNGNVMFLETKHEIERQRLVHGIRSVVARLSYLVIFGSKEVCNELLSYTDMGSLMGKSIIPSVMGRITHQLVDKVRIPHEKETCC
mmetsp:Transcript_30672/g.44797  ORF Transcript_30672/g.44797 Transcript_30672/m.44797 type:complete len:376 (+) Transcript_30672:1-1128(+)